MTEDFAFVQTDQTFPNLTETYNKLKMATNNRQGEKARDLLKERDQGFEGGLPNNTFLKLFNKQTLFFNNNQEDSDNPDHRFQNRRQTTTQQQESNTYDFQEKF